ncbi:uncharacterized protein LOC108087058 [Drosophila ficusphila]|uniref:uncharacterized protein LOC108087058 n=1 Tax=Drosophila ficusphila TaxID=30025 RepID=UPI0007E71AD8|nr:uncharacterized protein LOC108087058 [Drosophila ficusphila]
MLPSTEVLRRWRVSCIFRCSMACNNSANVPCKIDGCVGWLVGLKWLLYGQQPNRSRTFRTTRTWDLL